MSDALQVRAAAARLPARPVPAIVLVLALVSCMLIACGGGHGKVESGGGGGNGGSSLGVDAVTGASKVIPVPGAEGDLACETSDDCAPDQICVDSECAIPVTGTSI